MSSCQKVMDMSPVPLSAASLYDEDSTKHTQHVLQIFWWLPATCYLMSPAQPCERCSAWHHICVLHSSVHRTYSSGGQIAVTGHHVPQRWEKGLAATQKHVANVTWGPLTLLVNAKHIERWNGTPWLPKKNKRVTKEARPPYVCNRKCLTRWQRIRILCKWFKNVGGAVEMRAKWKRSRALEFTKPFSVGLGVRILSNSQVSDNEKKRTLAMDLLFNRRHTNRTMCICLPKKKALSLPNSTALNLKIKTQPDLSSDGYLKCPLKGMTAPLEGAAGYRGSKCPQVFRTSDAQENQRQLQPVSGDEVKNRCCLLPLVGPGLQVAAFGVWTILRTDTALLCLWRQWPFLSLSLFICQVLSLDWVIS